MLMWGRDTEAQGYNWFLCYHSWDSLPFHMLFWAPVVWEALAGNPESTWSFSAQPPTLTLPNSDVSLKSLQKCSRAVVRTQTTVAAASRFLTTPKSLYVGQWDDFLGRWPWIAKRVGSEIMQTHTQRETFQTQKNRNVLQCWKTS